MQLSEQANKIICHGLEEMLRGGFAPVVILLREFHYDKTGIVPTGLPYSAWSLLQHIRHRQQVLLAFMKNPEDSNEIWPQAYWGEKTKPDDEQEWKNAIADFENELNEMIVLIRTKKSQLFEVHSNGKTLYEAALIALHHNAYHIGQIKVIGRHLGVW